jgi:hypothetical protein
MPRKAPQSRCDDLDSPSDLKATVFRMLQGDDYWHGRIKRVLVEAGFGFRRIEREEAHPIWIAWLTRGGFDLSTDNRIASRQIRRVLTKSGLKIKADELNVLEQRGDRLRCVFIFPRGAPGAVT